MRESKILLVDDEMPVLTSLRRVLRQEDYEIVSTTSPEEALVLLGQQTFAVLVTDYRMPRMNGVELLAQARVLSPHTTRIVLTGQADMQVITDAINQGSVYRFLSKPWDDNELRATLRQALSQYMLITENRRLQELTQKQNEALTTLNENLEQKIQERTHDLQAAKDEAEKANKLKTQFMANISHELRTPLNIILGMAGLALDQKLSDQVVNYLSRVKTAGDRLLRIIEDLIEVSTLESHEENFSHQPFSLAGSLEGLQAKFQKAAQAKELMFYWDLPDEMVALTGNQNSLIRALEKMIENALKFTETGHIGLRVEKVEDHAEFVILKFDVFDTGVGISEDRQDEVFADFVQADGSATRLYEGIGIGLTIAAKHVGFLGSHIELKSKFGEGSHFFFSTTFQKAKD